MKAGAVPPGDKSTVLFEHAPTLGKAFDVVEVAEWKLSAENRDVPIILKVPPDHIVMTDVDVLSQVGAMKEKIANRRTG